MKQVQKIIVSMCVLTFLLVLPVVKVQAGSISSMSAVGGSGKVTVSGTAGSGVVAVAIMVYDETGTTLKAMETTGVDDSSKYATEISVDAGTYLIKVADYEGGDYQTATVTVTGSSSSSESVTTTTTTSTGATSPATIDGAMQEVTWFVYGLIILMAAAGAGIAFVVYKKKSM